MIVADMSWQLVLSVPRLLAEDSCNSLQQPTLKMLKLTWGEVARMMWWEKHMTNLLGHLMGLDM